MHSKIKGNIGQIATALVLVKAGFSVFTEEGDISKVDLIAEYNGFLIRFQCKAFTPNRNRLGIQFSKSGPNYSFSYKSNMFDYFSIYDLHSSNLYLIPSNFIDYSKSIILSFGSRQDTSWDANFFSAEKIIKELKQSL